MKYGCLEDFMTVRNNLMQAMGWFIGDVGEIGSINEIEFNESIFSDIKKDWLNHTMVIL